MVAHLDAVTSLAVDPNGLYLMSGSKYMKFHFPFLTVVAKMRLIKKTISPFSRS